MCKTRDRIADARLEACRRWPYASTAILSLAPVESPDMPHVASVDARWRLYYNVELMAQKTDDELVFTIQHEVSHLLLRHHLRGKSVLRGSDNKRWEAWNIACDIAIHSMMASDGITITHGCFTADDYGFDHGLSAEEYFGLLMKLDSQDDPDQDAATGGDNGDSHCQQSPDDGDGGSPGDVEEGKPSDSPGTGGSCSDGQQRPWEHSLDESPMAADGNDGEAESDVPDGLGESDGDAILQAVSDAAANSKGRGGSGLARVADHLKEPAVSIERLLRMAVMATSAKVKSGGGHSSYRRPSRRPSVGGALRARTVTPMPNIAVILDTSGSMGQEDLALAMGMIAKCLRSLHSQDGVRVITGDCMAATDTRAFHPRQIEMIGGGGTDMDVIIEDIAKGKEKPDLILCVTDGYTDWPREPTKMPVVACLTRSNVSPSFPIPTWMKHVCIKP